MVQSAFWFCARSSPNRVGRRDRPARLLVEPGEEGTKWREYVWWDLLFAWSAFATPSHPGKLTCIVVANNIHFRVLRHSHFKARNETHPRQPSSHRSPWITKRRPRCSASSTAGSDTTTAPGQRVPAAILTAFSRRVPLEPSSARPLPDWPVVKTGRAALAQLAYRLNGLRDSMGYAPFREAIAEYLGAVGAVRAFTNPRHHRLAARPANLRASSVKSERSRMDGPS